MNLEIVAEIDRRLDAIAREEGVTILLAVESGSRAWGFPSPDSDYDCRFFFHRPWREYLALSRQRDVIETPLTPVFDVNGWDLGKALRLLLKGNAVVMEWLTSPGVYRGDEGFRSRFRALADDVLDRGALAHHYYHLALSQMRPWRGKGEEKPAFKKVFYVLRPCLALCWLRERPGTACPPMNLGELAMGIVLDDELRADIDRLLRLKAGTRELGSGVIPPGIAAFVEQEISRFAAAPPKRQLPSEATMARIDTFFRREIKAP